MTGNGSESEVDSLPSPSTSWFTQYPDWFRALIKLQHATWDTSACSKAIPQIPLGSLSSNPAQPPYVFRGEPHSSGPIESSLYRVFREHIDQCDKAEEREVLLDSLQLCLLVMIAAELPDVDEASICNLRNRDELLRSSEARRLLYRLRHRGFPTNIVDFIENLSVALYFACQEGHDDEDGRILFCTKLPAQLLKPVVSDLRMVVQNSRFYWFTQGTLSVEKEENWVQAFPICKKHKPQFRAYLRLAHNYGTCHPVS